MRLHNKGKIIYTSIIVGTLIILAILNFSPIKAAFGVETTYRIAIVNGESVEDADFLKERVELDKHLISRSFSLTDDWVSSLSENDILILNDAVLSSTQSAAIQNFIQSGKHVFFIFGEKTTNNPSFLFEIGILTSADIASTTEQKIITEKGAEITYEGKIKWSSSPEIHNYTILDNTNGGVAQSLYTPKKIISTEPIIQESTRLKADPLILKYEGLPGDFFLITIWLNSPQINQNFQLWPVYNYAWFVLLADSVGLETPNFGDWEKAPVPHLLQQTLLGIYVILATTVMFYFFRKMQRKSAKKISEDELAEIAKEEEKKKLDLNDDWEQIGPHRQISGFLFSFFMALLVVLPQIVVATIIMPQFVQPFPQVAGWFSWTRNFFQAIWILFDVGTSFAMVKYFAEYRVKQPEKAVHYIQIFIWWQMFSGTVQIAIFAFLGSIIFPGLDTAHMAWIFILHSLIQYPGWFLVFMYVFQSLQRTDNYALSQILYVIFFPLIGQVPMILICRAWGAANPMYGEAFGAAVGYALGSYIAEWMTYGFGLYQFKKMGFTVSTLFRVDFTKEELFESLRYGIRLTVGSIMPPLVWLLQMYLVSIWVLNWSAEQGYFDLIWNFMGIIGVVSLFFNGALGAISESYSHKKFKLTELYITEGFKWGNFFLFFMVSILAAVGDKIIIGASGPTWARATIYIIPLLIFHFFGPISWLGDTVFEGTGRTDLAAYSWILEQILRALFLILFLHPEGPFRLGMLGVLLAYIPALIIKDIFLLAMIYKKVIKFKFYWYLNLLSMAIAAFVNFTLLYYLGEFIWNNIAQGILGALILMLVGMFGFLYIFAFLVGVFGGWDEHLLNEFKRSVKMMKGVRGFGNLLLRITEMGCRISPLHNKFPCDIWPIAMEEADALTKEKLVLEL